MANTLQLKNDIKKLKTALASKGLSASIKNKLKGKLEKAEKDLKSAAAPRKTTTTKSQLANLKELVKKKKYSVYKRAGVDLKKDSEEPALPIGRRVSKGLKANQHGSKKGNKGNVYYEYRANRLDVKQPSKSAKYPKLAEGGMMAKGAEINYLKKWKVKGINMQGRKFQKEITLGRMSDKNDVMYALKRMPDNNISEVTLIEEIKEEGGMMAHGGKLSKKDFFKKYEENEDENMHTENVVLLAENYGTESDIRDAKTILAKHESIGHLPTSLRLERDALHDKLWSKYVQSREDGGMMAHGGELTENAKKAWGKMDIKERMVFLKKQYQDKLENDNLLLKRLESQSKKDWDELAVKIQMEFEKSLGMMAEGGLTEKDKLGLKILKALSGFNDGQTLNGILELLGYSQYRFGKYATENQVNEVKKELESLIKLGYVEESGLGFKQTSNGRRYLDAFDYGSYAQGGVTEREVVDSNAQMVLSNVKEVKHHADELSKVVTKKSNIEAWVVAKIERASTDLSDITHYLEGQHDKMSMGGSVYNHLHKMDKK